MKAFQKFYLSFILLILISLSLSIDLHAREYDIKFQRISIEDGLSQSDVSCIIQDSKGFMWFGTEDGLNKYDGYKFTVYKVEEENPNSLSANWIQSIHEDKRGIIWIGTRGGGVNRFDPKKEKFTHYLANNKNSNSLSNDNVNSFCEDSSGMIWIGTDVGLNKLNPEKEEFTHFFNNPDNPNSLSNNRVMSIYEDRSGVLWIGTHGGGLNRFDRDKKKFIYYKAASDDPQSLSHNVVISIYEDRSGVLWIGTHGGGLNKVDREKEKFVHYQRNLNDPHSLSNNIIMSIHEDRSGVLWIGTNGGGVNRFDREKEKFIRYQNDPSDPNSLSNNRVMSIHEDRSGVLWIGTDIGLNTFDQDKKQFVLYQAKTNDLNSLSNSFVRPIYEDKSGVFWIGTYGGGLNKFVRKKGRMTHYKHDPNNPNSLSNDLVRAICEDRSGVLWIGTEEGLNKFDRKEERFIHYKTDPSNPDSLSNNLVYSIYEDKSGVLWIGTYGGGLNKLVPGAGLESPPSFFHYKVNPQNPRSINSNYAYTIYEDKSGVLWIGTFGGGLNAFDREKERFIHYTHNPDDPASLSNDILCIHEDQSGMLWIGTASGGLNKFDRTKKTFSSYKEKDGLPNNTIYGILEDEHGNLWLSHNKGISKFNPRTEMFKNYDVSDGLQSNEFNGGSYYKSLTGEMFFGGINGMNSFYPDDIKDNPHVPVIVITDLLIFNKSVPVGESGEKHSILDESITETKEIKLSYKDKVISFEFAVLHFASPDKNEYAYMMENFDEHWNYAGNRRFATYTNLPPGEYIFRVRGSNNDGVWNNNGISLRIQVIPAFWQTWWFHSSGIIATLFMIFSVYRLRTHNILKQSKQLEERVEERTFELQAANEKLQREVMERKRLEQQAQRRAAQAALIYEVGQRVSSELKLDELLSAVVNVISDSFDYYGVMMLLPDEEAKFLVLQAKTGTFGRTLPKDLRIPIGEGMIGYAAATGRTQVSGDVSQSPHYYRMAKEETKSELAVPVKSGDKVIGVLDIQSDEFNAFDVSDVASMEILSTQIAIAIENASLYEKAQKEIIERKRAEEEIEKRQKYLESVFQNAPDAIVTYDTSHKIIEWNQGAEKIFGYTRKEVLGIDIDDIVTAPDIMEEAKALSKKSLSGKRVPPMETVRYRKNGTPVNVIVAGSPIKIGGELHGVAVVYTDITELKQAEARYRNLFEGIPVGLYRTSPNGKILDANPALAKMLGYQSQEDYQAHGKVDGYANQEDRLQWQHLMEQEGVVNGFEVKWRTRDVNVIWVRESARAVRDNKGKVLYYEGAAEDITEQKNAEEEIEKRQIYLESVLNDAPDAIVTADASHRIIEWNRGAEKIFGYTRDEVLGRNIDDIVTAPDVMEEAVALTKKALSGEKVSPLETVRYRKDGTPVNVIVANSPIKIGAKLHGAVAVYTDITGRKILENQLKDFAYIVSHDLKAPLRAISQLATWISEDYADAFNKEGKEQLSLLVSRVKRMDNLIDGVLQYSRAGRLKEKEEEIDLAIITREAIDDIAPPKNIGITIEDKLPVILGDRVRISQVFQNLIGNAVKYMDKLKGKIRIRCVDEGNHWKFSVADNGPGIEEKYHDKIFQIFQTLESRDKRESTGVGLSVVKKIVELYGGKVWVESKVGHGSTFLFTLKKKGEKNEM